MWRVRSFSHFFLGTRCTATPLRFTLGLRMKAWVTQDGVSVDYTSRCKHTMVWLHRNNKLREGIMHIN
ncbi:hypothetical protein Plhal304r1_c005g0020421 [Plasmopara halstedii]